jgi:hypothetical protein
MRTGKPFFFIAHYGKESKEEIARPTYWFLKHYVKLDVFMDDEELPVGADRDLLLLQRAYECTHALILLTPSFRKSGPCVRELNTFMDRWDRRDGIMLIPALWRIDDVAGYCRPLDSIVWLRNRPNAMDAAAYMIDTLWPAILQTIPNYNNNMPDFARRSSKLRLERILAKYVREHRSRHNVPVNLHGLAERHEPCHCTIS